MTWQGKRRKQLPSNWGAIRKLVLERDGYRCTAPVNLDDGLYVAGLSITRCTQRATDVDHANGPHDHRLSSLRSLCGWHHKQKTQAEARAAAAKARALNPPVNQRLRPKSKHPGLA